MNIKELKYIEHYDNLARCESLKDQLMAMTPADQILASAVLKNLFSERRDNYIARLQREGLIVDEKA